MNHTYNKINNIINNQFNDVKNANHLHIDLSELLHKNVKDHFLTKKNNKFLHQNNTAKKTKYTHYINHAVIKDNTLPQPISILPDRHLPVKPYNIKVPHNPHAKYAVLSDVDGTITKGSLVLDHAIYLHNLHVIDLKELPEKWKNDPKNENLIVSLAESYREAIIGMILEDLQCENFLNDYLNSEDHFYSTLGELRKFRDRGWEIQLISGSPQYLVEPFAKHNGFYGKGSDYLTDNQGRFTGEIIGMFGYEAKSEYIKKLNVSRFNRILAFGDTSSDVPLFENADHSTLVSPSQETAAIVEASITIWE